MIKDGNGLTVFNVIAEGDCVKGDILSKSNVRINGEVLGSVKSEGKLIIGSNAYVEGCIKAVELLVEGCVKGEILVENRVHLKLTAKLFGDLSCKQLVLEPGAVFNGHCSIKKD